MEEFDSPWDRQNIKIDIQVISKGLKAFWVSRKGKDKPRKGKLLEVIDFALS